MKKSWLVIGVFIVLTFVVGDSNLFVRCKYDNKIRDLEKEIRHYGKKIEVNQNKFDDFQANKEHLERYAREEFYMKKPDEDIFIIVEK
ncbi:MAG: septum formation initiator family protein [Tannerella sp.]|nr:septum formation initiator family protein [Tannerella sp.]